MNKKPMSRFFNLNLHHDGGFTLVELIVVIAILAILAGVAIPAYSGYIKKAETAADHQLLSAVNTAFAAACMQNGVDPSGLDTKPTIDLVGNSGAKKVGTVSVYNADFQLFFAGNEESAFKTAESLNFNLLTGMFELSKDMVVSFGGVSINISEEVYEALRASTYATMGGEVLGESVNSVSSLAAMLVASPFMAWKDTGYMDAEPTGGMYSMVMNETFLASLGLTKEEVFDAMDASDASANAMAQYLTNGLVLYAAKDVGELNTNTIVSNMTSNPAGYVGQLKTGLTNGDSKALSETALVYSIYTSYVYDQDPTTAADKLATVNGSLGLISALDTMTNDPGFATYMQGQGADDVEAFKQAMGVINGAASQDGVSDTIMNQGFANTDLIGILQGVLGK